MPGMRLEICVEGVASALAAASGGADRIELCENLTVGGVTPSAGAIAVASERSAIPVHVLIRPRGGDFRYDAAEMDAIRRDVETAIGLGAAGVVLGVLRADRTIDMARMAPLIAAARPASVTFHRAFDMIVDPDAAIDSLVALGVDRVLTSGGAATAREGLPTLARLVERAAGRITILAGGRVTARDLPAFASAGLREAHVGSAACREGRATDADLVRSLIDAARRARVARRE